ncbi:hypothetical protein ACL02T_12625 [Pseudonocardia sp. RS010]|uniref:hypothetical protein n=1 Tax=Pseudonocardia sp. RS010 TaxID=3385979 RepID=UPI00399FF51C
MKFILGLAAAVLVVLLFVRLADAWPSPSDLLPDELPALPTAAQTCEAAGGEDVVRVLPDRTVEVVRCGGEQ